MSSTSEECPGCGKSYDYMGVHWVKSCGFPKIPEDKKQALIGVLMGDGWIRKPSGTNNLPTLEVASTSERYLNYLRNEISPFASSVREYKSGAVIARLAAESGQNSSIENTSDQWILRTRSHPYMKTLRGWYGQRGKSFPDDFPFTPTTLRHWYACDGTAGKNHISFAAQNEQNNSSLISRFADFGLDPVWDGHKLRLRQNDSHTLLDFMGDPVPGYEYKWDIR